MSDKPNSVDFDFIEKLKNQWMAIADAMVDPLMIVSDQYKVIKANLALAQHCNTDIKKLVGKTCYEVFANRQTPCDGCTLHKTIETKQAQEFELNLEDDYFFEVSSHIWRDPKGDQDAVVHVYRDRTESRKLHEQLLQSEKLASIGLLAGGVAHEINNPLGGILIFSEMILKEMSPEAEYRDDVEEIHKAALRCKDIVAKLLDFARQKQGVSKDLEDVNLKEVIEDALKLASVSHHEKSLTWEFKSESELKWVVLADKNKLIQVFLNLFQNAAQAVDKNGHIEVKAQVFQLKKHPWLRVSVKDNGVGMDEQQLKKIFDPFYTTKDPGEGTGLGLSITHSIIEEFSGRIYANATPGLGSTFIVELPLV